MHAEQSVKIPNPQAGKEKDQGRQELEGELGLVPDVAQVIGHPDHIKDHGGAHQVGHPDEQDVV